MISGHTRERSDERDRNPTPVGGSPIHDASLESFCDRRDRERLEEWLRPRHVIRWWGDPEERLRECPLRTLGGGHALIRADGIAVGYLLCP